MLLWIKAAAVTALRWAADAAVLAVGSLALLAMFAAIAYAFSVYGDEIVIALLAGFAALLLGWIFAEDVKIAHERLLCRARLEESARGGDRA